MKSGTFAAVCVVIAMIGISVIGAITLVNYSKVDPPNISQATNATPQAVDYGTNVFYIDNADEFGVKLEAFRRTRSDLRVISIAGDGAGAYGENNGFWVVCEPVATPEKVGR